MPVRVRTARPGLITILDAAIVICVSAAAVMLLGGRTRFHVGGNLVTLRAPVNAALIAAGLAIVRIAMARFARPLPLLPPSATWLELAEAERGRFLHPEPFTRRIGWYAAAAIAGSVIWVIPHALHLRSVPDWGDPIFSAWRLAALAHQLATDPRHLWNGNIFYPHPLTITYSDSLFLQSLITAPFLRAGADPLIVMNVLMVLSYPARGLAFFFLAWRMTGDPQAALVAALAGAWSPFYGDHYSQLELQSTAFMPLAFLFGLRMLAAPGWRTGAAFGAAFAAQCLACMYIGVMLASWLVPFLCMIALAWRAWRSPRIAAALAAAALVAAPIVAALGLSYMKSREAHGDRSRGDVWVGSALPSDYGNATYRLVSYRWQPRTSHRSERELFPGSSSLALGAIGAVPPITPVAMAAIASGAVAFDWSLGFNGLTYDDFYKRFAAYRGMRVAARFSAMVDTALVLLAAYGARRLLRRRGALPRAVICGALCAGVLLDLRMSPGLNPYLPTVPSIYARVSPSMVPAELPEGHPVDYMYFSTRHWAKLLTGYSGFFPDMRDYNAAEAAFPLPESIAGFRRLGATHLTYNCGLEQRPWRCKPTLDALDANPQLELVASERWLGAEVRLYRYR